jgi:hypothetical protein
MRHSLWKTPQKTTGSPESDLRDASKEACGTGARRISWQLQPKQVTGDTAYGTTEYIAAVERAGIRAYVPLTGAGKARPYFSKEEFTHDPQQDLYQCPAGKVLRPKTFRTARKQILYKTEPGTCDSCSMRA